MSNIHDESWKGTLTASTLKSYIATSSSIINSDGGIKNVTPLAAACWGGHLNVVKLLLSEGADPNAQSPRQRTPFYFVTTRTPPENRGAIVQALIGKDANLVNLPCDENENTPIMNAISQTKDKEVIHQLVDHGATLDKKNKKNETAETLAKKHGLSRHIQPKSERETSRGKIVDMIVSAVQLVIAYSNKGFAETVVRGAVKNLYGISGKIDPDLEKIIPQPKTVAEFKTSLNNYVKGSKFEKFFAPDDPFLQTLATKANALRDDPTTDLGKPENIGRLTRLSLYQPVIYCDDSSSMKYYPERYRNQRDLVTRIARIATKIVPDDMAFVDLRFINSASAQRLDASTIERAIDAVTPSPGTRIGTQLREKILKPLVYDVISNSKPTTPIPFKRPLLVCIITDGCPSPEPTETLMKAVLECKQKLEAASYDPAAVMFLISQVGTDDSAAEFLDTLRDETKIQDVVYVTAETLDKQYKALKQNERGLESWLLHLLAGPLMERHEE